MSFPGKAAAQKRANDLNASRKPGERFEARRSHTGEWYVARILEGGRVEDRIYS